MDSSFIANLSAIMGWAIFPILGITGWFFKTHADQVHALRSEIEEIEDNMHKMEIENTSIKAQLDNITERLNELRQLLNIIIDKPDSRSCHS